MNGSVLSNIAVVNFAVDTDSGGTDFLLRLTTDIAAAVPDGKALPGTATSGFVDIVMVAFDEQGKIATYQLMQSSARAEGLVASLGLRAPEASLETCGVLFVVAGAVVVLRMRLSVRARPVGYLEAPV